MDTMKVKEECDTQMRCSDGQTNEEIGFDSMFLIENGKFDNGNPSDKHGKFHGKHSFVHVTDCEIVFEIVIKNKYNIVDEAVGSTAHQVISQNEAAYMLKYMGFNHDEIVQAIQCHSESNKSIVKGIDQSVAEVIRENNSIRFGDPNFVCVNQTDCLEMMLLHDGLKTSVNHDTPNVYGQSQSTGSQQTKKECEQKTEQSDLYSSHPSILGNLPSTEKTEFTSIRTNFAPEVKSDLIVNVDESTDEYSDNDFNSYASLADDVTNVTTHSNNNDRSLLQGHVSEIGVKDTKTLMTSGSDPQYPDDDRRKRYLKCVQCDYTTVHAGHLKRHKLYKHTMDRAFKCSQCNFQCVEAGDLRKHVYRKHTGVLPFECLVCEYKCDRHSELKEHLKTEHKTTQNIFECTECHVKFERECHLVTHLSRKHSGYNLFKCYKCNFTFPTELELKKHHFAKHEGEIPFKCTSCNYSCKTHQVLMNHVQNNHSSHYQCSKCHNKFSKLNDLKQHFLTSHSTADVYDCALCDYKTTNMSHLKRHKLYKHGGVRAFTCGECSFKSVEKCELKKHIKVKHLKQWSVKYPKRDHSSDDYSDTPSSESKKVKIKVESDDESTDEYSDNDFNSYSNLADNSRTHSDDNNRSRLQGHDSEIGTTDTKTPITTVQDQQSSANDRRERHLKRKLNFECKQCHHSFDRESNLLRHLSRKHSVDNPFKCNQCKFTFLTEIELKKHRFAKQKGEIPFECSTCDYTCRTHRVSTKYEKKYHTLPYQCSKCDFEFTKLNDLKQHSLTVHTTVGVLDCALCDYKTTHKMHLKRHKLYKHGGVRRFTCAKCSFKSVDKYELKKHIKLKHLKQRSVKYPKPDHSSDDYSDTSFSESKKSKMIKHSDNNDHSKCDETPFKSIDGVYKCEECDFTCTESRKMTMHMPKHTLPVMCHICSFRTASNGCLTEHIKSRHADKKFHCQECEYKCTASSKLQTHINVKHRGQRKILCPQCGYRCSQNGHLQRHIVAKHTGELAFECEQCDYKCNRVDNLRKHVMCKHTGERPFKCDICNFGCTRADVLKKHVLKHSTEATTATANDFLFLSERNKLIKEVAI